MLVTTIMVVLSVQISVNLSVLKGWGLHPLDDLATLAEVLEQFKRGEIEGCSSFVFLDTPGAAVRVLHRSKFVWAVSNSFPLCTRMGEIHGFGRYLKYVITPIGQPAFADVGCQEKPRDAFRIMMDAQLVLHIPEKVTDKRMGKDRLKNKVVELLNRSRFGRYLKYVITPSGQPAFADVGCQEKPRDTFRIMMDGQLVLRIPEKVTQVEEQSC